MKDPRGFTLLELLISITLTAVLVTVLSMSLRTGLRAWNRGHEINESLVPVSAVEGLLGRQLRAVVKKQDSRLSKFAQFSGEKEKLSFITTHVPMGALGGGIFRVVYRFDREEKRLVYGQKVLTRPDDARNFEFDSIDPEQKEDLARDGWSISVVPDLKPLKFAYKKSLTEGDDPGEWADEWSSRDKIPAAVALGWESENVEDADSVAWSIFYTAPFPLEVRHEK